MKNTILFLLLIVPNIAFAAVDDWLALPNKDNWSGYTAAALLLVDWGQTLNLNEISSEDPQHYESNPILGKYPSRRKINLYFSTILIGHFIINNLPIKKRYKDFYNGGIIALEIKVIAHNYNAGIKIKFH